MTAQKIDREDVYPIVQKIDAKWPKSSFPKLEYNDCLEGNCMEGDGVRLQFTGMIMEDSKYFLFFTLVKGKFEEQGKVVTGKRYDFKLHFTTDKKRDFIPVNKYDFTDVEFLEKYYVGEGQSVNNKWDGEVLIPAFVKRFPDYKARKVVYRNNLLQWMDVDLPANHRFKSYKGRTFITGDFLSGKAVLANGDVYEGFFFQNDFFGPGKLTMKNGKVRQGIWQFDSLMVETPIQWQSFLSEAELPAKASTDYNFKTYLFGQQNFNPAFYGDPVVNNIANGWGLSEFYWSQQVNSLRGVVYGQWKDNKLDGPGIIVVTPEFNQLKYGAHNSNSAFNELNYYTGIFRNGELVQGSRIYTTYNTQANRDLDDREIFKLNTNAIQVYTGSFRDRYTIEGCGSHQKSYGLDQQGRYTPDQIIEGKFVNGRPVGFYFESEKNPSRKLETLRYTTPHQLTEEIVRGVENDNDFCMDVIRTLKPQFIAGMRKKLQADLVAAEEAKKPPPPFDPYKHLPAETKITATSADYANVDWDALGFKAEETQTTREHIKFLEEVSKDVRKYLNETITVRGQTYKKYARSRRISSNSSVSNVHSGQELNIAGTKVPILILHYTQYTGSDAKAKVVLQYEGKKLEDNKILTGGSCNMVTQCSNQICKTQCTGSFEFESYQNRHYTLWLERTGNWSGSRMFWIVLKDQTSLIK